MSWVLRIEEVGDGKVARRKKVLTLKCPTEIDTIADLGLRLADAKRLLASVQKFIMTRQLENDSVVRRHCGNCKKQRRIKDYRTRTFQTLFGSVTVRRPRFACPNCAHNIHENPFDPLRGLRSTPELDTVRAKLAAQLPYRVAGRLLADLLPVSGGVNHTSIRNHTLAIGNRIGQRVSDECTNQTLEPAASLTLGLDTAFVRASPGQGMRHLPVLVGHLERDGWPKCVFSAIGGTGEALSTTVRTQLDRMDYVPTTKITVLSDGAEGLRNIARTATGSSVTPILDWFHIAMRLRHLKQAAKGLSIRVPTHRVATAKIQVELERLHWRLWRGNTDAVDLSLKRLMTSIGALGRYRRGGRHPHDASRKVCIKLYELKRYVRGQEATIIDYHSAQKQGLRVSTSMVESEVNYLVNHRMNKRRQMRWSAIGARQLLQVRAALINDEFERLAESGTQTTPGVKDRSRLQLAA